MNLFNKINRYFKISEKIKPYLRIYTFSWLFSLIGWLCVLIYLYCSFTPMVDNTHKEGEEPSARDRILAYFTLHVEFLKELILLPDRYGRIDETLFSEGLKKQLALNLLLRRFYLRYRLVTWKNRGPERERDSIEDLQYDPHQSVYMDGKEQSSGDETLSKNQGQHEQSDTTD